MAPRKETAKKTARKTNNRQTNHNTPKNAARVRKPRSEVAVNRRSHGYNLRRPSSSVVVLGESCACAERDRRRLHRLHLHSAQCTSLSKRVRQRQSRISVVTVSSGEDEDLAMRRTASWLENVEVEERDHDHDHDRDRDREGSPRVRGRAGASGGGSEPEAMLVDTMRSDEAIHMETESVNIHMPESAASPKERFEIACAMNLSFDLEQEFRPLCVSTPEGCCPPVSPRPIDVPGPSAVALKDCGDPPATSVSAEPTTFKLFTNSAGIGDSTGLPVVSINTEKEAFQFVLDPARLEELEELLPISSPSSDSPANCDSASPKLANAESTKFFTCARFGGDCAGPPSASVVQEGANNQFNPFKIGDAEPLPVILEKPEDETSQFLFGPPRARRLWQASASPPSSASNLTSYEFGMSGIQTFEPVTSGFESVDSGPKPVTSDREDVNNDGGVRKRKRSPNQVPSTSRSVPPVIFEQDK